MGLSLKIKILVLVSVLSVSLGAGQAFGQKIALKTNAVAWGGLTPNLGFELVIGERSTIDFVMMGHSKPYGLDSKMFTLQPEYRYWLSGRPMIHTFVGATAIWAAYDMILKESVRKGNAAALGLTAGYVLPLNKKWNVEFSGGMGLVSFFQRMYHVGDDVDHWVNIPTTVNSVGYKILPIDLGISFTYIIK